MRTLTLIIAITLLSCSKEEMPQPTSTVAVAQDPYKFLRGGWFNAVDARFNSDSVMNYTFHGYALPSDDRITILDNSTLTFNGVHHDYTISNDTLQCDVFTFYMIQGNLYYVDVISGYDKQGYKYMRQEWTRF